LRRGSVTASYTRSHVTGTPAISIIPVMRPDSSELGPIRRTNGFDEALNCSGGYSCIAATLASLAPGTKDVNQTWARGSPVRGATLAYRIPDPAFVLTWFIVAYHVSKWPPLRPSQRISF